MSNSSFKSSRSLLRVFLVPYTFLLVLYLLVIGCGSTWLYLTARHAQTELVTGHIVEVVSPFLKQLSEEYQANSKINESFLLSKKVSQLLSNLTSFEANFLTYLPFTGRSILFRAAILTGY